MKTIEATYRTNLAALIDECGSQAKLAKLIEKSPAQISQWLNASVDSKTGKPRSMSRETAREIERLTGKPSGWMDTDHSSNVEPGPDIRGFVPLISSVQAGEWSEIVDNFQPGDAKEWLPCPVKHGPNTFCLRVDGQSMSNPGYKPSYEEGDIIFVDPGRAACPGDRVVVRLESQAKATFKQYLEEDGRKMLKALNPDWKPRYVEINGEATICGVVIGKWVPE